MPKKPLSQVVTASDLLMGDVIYLMSDNSWSRELREGELITDEAHAQLRLIEANQQQSMVVGAYLTDVTAQFPDPQALHFRETFRATGPSNYAHGKQDGKQHSKQDGKQEVEPNV